MERHFRFNTNTLTVVGDLHKAFENLLQRCSCSFSWWFYWPVLPRVVPVHEMVNWLASGTCLPGASSGRRVHDAWRHARSSFSWCLHVVGGGGGGVKLLLSLWHRKSAINWEISMPAQGLCLQYQTLLNQRIVTASQYNVYTLYTTERENLHRVHCIIIIYNTQ